MSLLQVSTSQSREPPNPSGYVNGVGATVPPQVEEGRPMAFDLLKGWIPASAPLPLTGCVTLTDYRITLILSFLVRETETMILV